MEDVKNKCIFLAGSVGIIAAIYFGIKYVFPLFAPFVLAFFVAVIIEKWVKRLSRFFKGSRMAAATLIMVLITAVIGAIVFGIGFFAIKELRNLLGNFKYYQEMYDGQIRTLCERIDAFLGIREYAIYDVVGKYAYQLMGQVELGSSFSMAAKWAAKMVITIGGFFIMLISVVFISRDLYIYRKIKSDSQFSKELSLFWISLVRLGNVYFKTQLVIICCTSIVCTLGLFIIHNPYAIVIGIAIGILDALPLFGTGTVLIPWAIWMALQGKIFAAAMLATIFAITYLIREILESKLMGDKLDVPPVTMMAAIYVGLLIFGFWGFVLGPVAYSLFRAGTQVLKSYLKSGKIPTK